MNEDDFQLVLQAKRQIHGRRPFALSSLPALPLRRPALCRYRFTFHVSTAVHCAVCFTGPELRCHRQYGVGDQKGSHRRHRTAYPQRSRQSRPVLATEKQTLRVSAKTSIAERPSQPSSDVVCTAPLRTDAGLSPQSASLQQQAITLIG